MQDKILDRFFTQIQEKTTEPSFQLGISPNILCTTPFSKDIAQMAYADGRMFYHYELRGHFPVTEEMAPEVPVWSEEGTVPVWKDGHLIAPKYFSFFLESVFAPFNPSHRSKWPIHELLHTLTRFYWNPQMNRFSCYMGARLSELIPVVHWYGLDEIFRKRCLRHQGIVLYEDHCPDCEKQFVPFYTRSTSDLKQEKKQAELWLSKAQQHFDIEMEAIQKELELGYRVPVSQYKLDSSSDAVGYLKGHYNRLTSWSFGAWVTMFLKDGEDYFSSIQAHYEHQQKLWKCIVEGRYLDENFGNIADNSMDANLVFQQRQRRYVQDVGLRVLTALEFCDEEIEESVWPFLVSMADFCNGESDIELSINDSMIAPEIHEMVDGIFDAFRTHQEQLPEGFLTLLPALGHTWDGKARETTFVEQGIQSGLLDALEENEEWQQNISEFVASDIFEEQKPLVERFAIWSKNNLDKNVSSLIEMETWLRSSPHQDEEASNFAVLPQENWGEGVLRFHKTYRRATYATKDICSFLGWNEEDFETEQLELFAVWGVEGPEVFVMDEKLTKIFEMVEQNDIEAIKENHAEDIDGLLQVGVLVWLPKAV